MHTTQRSNDFDSLRVRLASPEEILSWSHGEVLEPETINYRTQKPEKHGLFDERIFGPEKDWECYCGKYRRIRYKGVVCDRCGVEVTRSSVRRERMGHITLSSPVTHIWYLRGIPSRVGLLFNMSVQDLEKVVYFAGYIVTDVDEEARKQVLDDIEREFKSGRKAAKDADEKQAIKEARDTARSEIKTLKIKRILSEVEYRELSLKYGHVFDAGIGAEALRAMAEKMDLEALEKRLAVEWIDVPASRRRKLTQRLSFVRSMIASGVRPEWMFISVLPVMPPDLRPMVQLDGGRYATSDVNDLYRRVINRNNRLKRLKELNSPEVIRRNEKRMLQEALDALIDNSARQGQRVVTSTTGQRRRLKSLSDDIKGKQGRFRQNLLGKRVDYSGRSVIVVGPTLKLHECGLPKHMALELFKPFVINQLIQRELAYNVRGAGRLIEEKIPEVWEALEEVIKDRYVLLNRAPTLHRLGVQAFKPILIEGSAIQIHPLVCVAFNADFDGDQMAVHVPLSEEAQTEARELILSSQNLLKPATGDPVVVPTQDMVLGAYYMTTLIDGGDGSETYYASVDDAVLAYQYRKVDLRSRIFIPMPDEGVIDEKEEIDEKKSKKRQEPAEGFLETSIGRIIFNRVIPEELPYYNVRMNKGSLRSLTATIIKDLGNERSAIILDRIKNLSFKYATKSGITWALSDLVIPDEKKGIMDEAEAKIVEIHKHFDEGLLTEEERYARALEVWRHAKTTLEEFVPGAIAEDSSVHMIYNSGARGSWGVTTQVTGMRGLMANPAGEIIEIPVKSNFKEGQNVLEYFISTHGARKGTADTALRTATAGYLTRRLVDVAQDIIVREEDCEDTDGIMLYREDSDAVGQSFGHRVFGRYALQQISHPKTKEVLAKKGELIDTATAEAIDASGIQSLVMRSIVSCKTPYGVCQKCYGYDLGKNEVVEQGEAVGIVTAQAIGEPGTQLTMRTFHTGGVAGGADITQGLPRVEEIFDARSPKGEAPVALSEGTVTDILQKGAQVVVTIKHQDAGKGKPGEKEYALPAHSTVLVEQGEKVDSGTALSTGSLNLQSLFRSAGEETVRRYIVREAQRIYTAQGGGLHDKHIELIVRKMFSRVRITHPGDTSLLPGQIVERDHFNESNSVLTKGQKPAEGRKLLMGITKVALTAQSFLSAASFQETVRVLVNASVEGRVDPLRGMKENVIIGRLIPAGTAYRGRFDHLKEEETEQEDEKK